VMAAMYAMNPGFKSLSLQRDAPPDGEGSPPTAQPSPQARKR